MFKRGGNNFSRKNTPLIRIQRFWNVFFITLYIPDMTPLPCISWTELHYLVYPGQDSITLYILDRTPLPCISRTGLHYLVYPGQDSITLYILDRSPLPCISWTGLHYLVYPGQESITLYIPDMPPILTPLTLITPAYPR